MKVLHGQLVEVLQNLRVEQWNASMACAGWTVKDVAAHLLDGNQRRLSLPREGHEIPFRGGDIGAWLNQLNAAEH